MPYGNCVRVGSEVHVPTREQVLSALDGGTDYPAAIFGYAEPGLTSCLPRNVGAGEAWVVSQDS